MSSLKANEKSNINIIGKALDELYRIFDILNEKFFYNHLDIPVITIQKTRGATLGHFTLQKIWQNKNEVEAANMSVEEADSEDKDSYYEINIDPRWFYERSAVDVVETLTHEMVHYFNHVNGIKDCSGQIHNRNFKNEAERVGLVCEKDKKYGYGITSLSNELREYIEKEIKPDETVFEYFRANIEIPKIKKKNKSLLKYTCPSCGLIARGKKDIHIKCGECDVELEMEDLDEEDED